VKLRILNQKAGTDPIGNELKGLLARSRNPFLHVKILMAFVNRDGLRYVRKHLEAFYDGGGILEFIVGIDNGVTTHEALTYLRKRFPEASLFVFHDKMPRKVFHHKAVILENDKSVTFMMGSPNLTLGGMFANFESAVLVDLDRTDDASAVKSLLEVWDAYRNPKAPMHPQNLQEVSAAWLQQHATSLRAATRRQRRAQTRVTHDGFPETQLPAAKLEPWPTTTTSKKKTQSSKKERRPARKLLVEVLKETGAGGTQIQLPTECLTDYFAGSMQRPIHIRLSFRAGRYRDGYIHHFDNNTHRISIRELSGVPRPVILEFEQDSSHRNTYRCRVLHGRNYRSALKQCTEQTRTRAKRWGIVA
jgi:HKD family nuclease